ncbi:MULTISPECIES: c-type cytochrome [Microvirga]|uniref:c-type cytochrome n=1 Tax=Microvirga TaxID=186650 RepID=UPI001CFFC38B|nr:cytochrome c [Microvirga lenta]MCB5175721.1 cytochrome c [Microvirga lenta]
MRPAFVLLGAALLAACDSGTEVTPSISSTRVVQRAYVPAPPGVVPRGTSAYLAAVAPPGPEVTPELIRRGQERFLAFCSPCHGPNGQGNGPVVSRGFPAPPSYHQERIQALSPAQIVTVITLGKGMMFSYADRVSPEDRWAIAHYVKQLQASGPASAAGQRPVP